MSEEQTQTLSTFFPAIGNVLTIIFVGALLLIAWKRIRDFQVRGKSVLSPEDAVLRSVDLRTESTTKFS
jgi:cell division septal protein FtsQ